MTLMTRARTRTLRSTPRAPDDGASASGPRPSFVTSVWTSARSRVEDLGFRNVFGVWVRPHPEVDADDGDVQLCTLDVRFLPASFPVEMNREVVLAAARPGEGRR